MDVALAVAPRHVVDVVHAVAAVALHLEVGVVILRRNVLRQIGCTSTERQDHQRTTTPSIFDEGRVSRYRPQGRSCLIRGACIQRQDHTTERAWDVSVSHEAAGRRTVASGR